MQDGMQQLRNCFRSVSKVGTTSHDNGKIERCQVQREVMLMELGVR
jgi:hypothetical protein